MRFVCIFAICIFNIAFGVLPKNPPQSSIPEGEQYYSPCFVGGITIPNVSGFTAINNNNLYEKITKVEHNQVFYANCKENYYVLQKNNNIATRQKKFELRCDDGKIIKKNEIDFCHKMCSLEGLEDLGYQVMGDKVLFPGQSTQMRCPKNQVTTEGFNFTVACGLNGVLQSSSARCFDVHMKCVHKNKHYPEGSRLSCQTRDGLAIVSCEKSRWQDNEIYLNNSARCSQSISDLDFEFQNFNLLVIENAPVEVVLAQIENFCENNPDDSNCKPKLKNCKYKGKEYAPGTQVVFACMKAGGAKIIYQCLEKFVYIRFFDPQHPLSQYFLMSFDECSPDDSVEPEIYK